MSLLLAGCSGVQSALDPAGSEAQSTATLFWVMAAGGAVIWCGVMALLIYAAKWREAVFSEAQASRLILWGGAVFPAVTLFVLLIYAFWLMPQLRPWVNIGTPSITVEVSGEQFWWRVAYRMPDGRSIAAANEVRLPVGQRVEFALTSPDVIHSFWIPSLAGKMDMIPGRVNRLSITATKAGLYRAACAEYCGISHALMAFTVLAMEPAEFAEWAASQAAPAAAARDAGLALFLRHGCAACHAIAGTEASGVIGPDLSHLGSRHTVGAGLRPNTVEDIALFIADTQGVKPGAKMPSFGMLPRQEIEAIAGYLKGLQ